MDDSLVSLVGESLVQRRRRPAGAIRVLFRAGSFTILPGVPEDFADEEPRQVEA